MCRRVVFFMIRSAAHVLFCIIKKTTRRHISRPTLRYDTHKEAARMSVQYKRPITSQPYPQLHHTHNTKEETRQG
jgi:hypothetical protein